MTEITIKEKNSFVTFEYDSNIDSLETQEHYNVLTIIDNSEDLYEYIDVCNGYIIIKGVFENEIKFPMMYKTESFEHSFSVIGQFIWVLNKLNNLKRMSNGNKKF